MTPADIKPEVARQIVETLGSHGTPPEWGFQLFTAGLGDYLDIVEEDYLKTFVAHGGSAFKMIVGAYGGGKTHFLYNVREKAWKNGYVVSYVSLRHDESPFHRMDRVYRAIALSLTAPLSPEELLEGSEKGLGAFLKNWLVRAREKLQQAGLPDEKLAEALQDEARTAVADLEGSHYAAALRHAFLALAAGADDDFEVILQWLTADGYDRHIHHPFGILRPLDRAVAFSAIRSLVQWVRNLGYRGLVILLDEAEQIPSMSSKQKEVMLSNLRELIDECGQTSFRNVMIFYAVPGEQFLDGQANVYEALKQRVHSVFDFYNPSGVKVYLDRIGTAPLPFLQEVGLKLAGVFARAFGVDFAPDRLAEAVRLCAEEAYEQRFGDIGYKRLFVQGAIRAFHYLRRRPDAVLDAAWARAMLEGGV